MCIEVWDDKIVDKFMGRACVLLAPLARVPGGGVGVINLDVELAGGESAGVTHTLLGAQHGAAGFKARASITLTRMQPDALCYAAEQPSAACAACPPGGAAHEAPCAHVAPTPIAPSA